MIDEMDNRIDVECDECDYIVKRLSARIARIERTVFGSSEPEVDES